MSTDPTLVHLINTIYIIIFQQLYTTNLVWMLLAIFGYWLLKFRTCVRDAAGKK